MIIIILSDMEVDKVPARDEPKYGGIKAMPFIIGKIAI